MELAAALKRLLADEVAMSLLAQGAHWNVEGSAFHSFHDFFAKVYEDVHSAIDPTAENIRKIGAYAPFTLPTLDGLRSFEDKRSDTDPLNLTVSLSDANEKVIESIAAAFEAAEEADEQGIMDFLASRDDAHKKWRWQFEATLKR